MSRITDDPTMAICPSFEDPEWDFLRQLMINPHQWPPPGPPLTIEEAPQRMKDAWTQENNVRVAAWNEQLERDQAERDEQERLVQEEEGALRAQRDREAAHLQREVEKKRPWPAAYALNKINNLQYVELDYFTRRGRQEAAANAYKSVDLDLDIRRDEDLSWGEMMDAKNTMLHFMAQCEHWPAAHAESIAAFYVALELHPRRRQANGEKVLLMYQGRVRREWFRALARNEGFNIAIIVEDLLRSLAEEVNDAIRQREFEQIRRMAHAAFESSMARFPPRRHRERDRETPGHRRDRSASPSRMEYARRHRHSRSPRNSDHPPPRQQQAGRSSRDSDRQVKKDRGEEPFQLGAGPRGGVCAICLGLHDHEYYKCEGPKLWDGSNGAARKVERGRLVGPGGAPLCFDWQLPRGCQSTLHNERHKCSGCGKAGHGAQTCPRAEKV
jgi:hypothetical protein